MSEQLINYGFVIGFNALDKSFCYISDGYFTIEAYVSSKTPVQVGKGYTVYKKGTTYFVGTEVNVS
jgi:hypothetical protein